MYVITMLYKIHEITLSKIHHMHNVHNFIFILWSTYNFDINVNTMSLVAKSEA